MKRLIALAALLIPICLFSQGFGSFSHDQPFFASDNSLSVSNYPVAGMNLWWIFTDLNTNSKVVTWTDRIQSKVLTQVGEGNITNRTTGVTFEAGTTFASLTNSSGGAFITNSSNFAVGFIFKSRRSTSGSSGCLYGDGSSSRGMLLSASPASQNPCFLDNYIPGPSQTDVALIQTNVWMDLILCITNSANNVCVIYTNGSYASLSNNLTASRIGVIGDWINAGQPKTKMDVLEVIGLTNITPVNVLSIVSNFHYYHTNTYAGH